MPKLLKIEDLQTNDLVEIVGKPAHKGMVIRVHEIKGDWAHFRIPNEDGSYGEGRLSFAIPGRIPGFNYLDGAKFKKVGVGVPPEKPKVYSKPKVKLMPGQVVKKKSRRSK